ncbi:MAG: hypothetical protein WD648_12600, partial [Planctomycetaceae bacterium]
MKLHCGDAEQKRKRNHPQISQMAQIKFSGSQAELGNETIYETKKSVQSAKSVDEFLFLLFS